MPGLHSAGVSAQGNVRGNNEDRVYLDPARGIYLVVDGMGGQAAGEEAARIAVETIRLRLERQTETPELRIREAIALANNAIYEAAVNNPAWRGMACVLTVALLEGDRAVVGHVGDSRLYLLSNGGIQKLTRDHSPVGEREDAGELSEEAARKHPRRNEVYRDVGSTPRTPDDPDFIDIVPVAFPAASAMLVCSDGLSDVLSSARIRQVVEAHAGDCDAAVKQLVAEAVKDGKDNVSIVLVERDDFARGAAWVPPPVQSAVRSPELAVPVEKKRGGLRAALLLIPLVALGALAAWWFTLPTTHFPGLIHVGGTNALQSLPEAINIASNGDTVELAPGTYPDQILLRDGLRILAEKAGTATLSGGLVADGVGRAIVSGVSVRGPAGIQIRNSNIEFDGIEVSGAAGAGIEYSGDSAGVLRGSRITGNGGSGIVVRDTASPGIENSFITKNAKAGIEFVSTAEPHIHSNGIGDNGAEAFWLLADPPVTLLTANTLAPAKKLFRVVPKVVPK